MKECSICKEIKLLSEYYSYLKHSKTKGEYLYYHPYCKVCSVEKAKKRMYENYEDHKKAALKSNSRPEARERHYESMKKYIESGKQGEWKRRNKDRLKGYNLYRMMNKMHEITKDEWEVCKKFFNYRCAYCGISEVDSKEKYGQYFHKEHVDHNGSNMINNCVPSCKSCNSSKHQMTLEEFCMKKNISKNTYLKIIYWLENCNDVIEKSKMKN